MTKTLIATPDPDDYPDRYADRRETARARLGTRNPRCTVTGCRETDPLAFTGTQPTLRCYAHDRIARGLNPIENQHPSGRANDPTTVPIPANDHRVIDAAKQHWPPATLDGEHGPLRQCAAAVRGWLDTLWVIITRCVGWVPAMLEALDDHLVARLGARWWDDFNPAEAR
jgi:hypothetical protein